MRIRYRARSLADIEEIYHYLKLRSPSGAANVLAAIKAGIQAIAENPLAWQATDDPGVHSFVLTRYSYRIFYTVLDQDTVEILHVRHTSRRPWEAGD
jgi:toxin ParE1/3/4